MVKATRSTVVIAQSARRSPAAPAPPGVSPKTAAPARNASTGAARQPIVAGEDPPPGADPAHEADWPSVELGVRRKADQRDENQGIAEYEKRMAVLARGSGTRGSRHESHQPASKLMRTASSGPSRYFSAVLTSRNRRSYGQPHEGPTCLSVRTWSRHVVRPGPLRLPGEPGKRLPQPFVNDQMDRRRNREAGPRREPEPDRQAEPEEGQIPDRPHARGPEGRDQQQRIGQSGTRSATEMEWCAGCVSMSRTRAPRTRPSSRTRETGPRASGLWTVQGVRASHSRYSQVEERMQSGCADRDRKTLRPQ